MPKTVELDVRGMKCPIPTLRMSNALAGKDVAPGDVLVVQADCPTFESEVRIWCRNWNKTLVSVTEEGSWKTVRILI